MTSIKAIPLMNTVSTVKYVEFISQPFTVESLSTKFGDSTVLFSGWYGRDLGGVMYARNDDGVVLEFYPTYYTIKLPKETANYKIPLPKTIDMFIMDMERYNIQLFWTDWVDTNFEPMEYLPKEQIKDYFVDLLGKMDKSQELL
jgi:hypothetical protein